MARTDAGLTPEEILIVEELTDISNNSVIYKDNTGSYQSVALGTSNQVLTSNGTTSAPSFEDVTSGASTLADISVNSTDATKSTYTMSSGVPVEFKSSGGNSIFYIDETNQVLGIGTSSVISGVGLLNFGSAPTIGNKISSSGTGAYNFYNSANQVVGGIQLTGSSGEMKLYASTSYFTTIYSNNNERMRILSNGNIIIGGTTDSTGKLQVTSNTGIHQQRRYNSSNYATFQVDSSGNGTFALTGTSPEFTFSQAVNVPDEAYGAGWNGSTEVPTKNAVYDKIESIAGGGLSTDQRYDLSGTYASTTTFTYPGNAASAANITGSLFTCLSSGGGTRRIGYIKSASHSAGTVTVTVVTDTDLASGDNTFKVTPYRKVVDYQHLISIPGEVIADASNPQGTWLLDIPRDSYLLPVNSAVRTAAAGSGAACAWNVYKGTTNLFTSAQDMTTNTTFNEKRPDTNTLSAGDNISLRITSSAGATNKASDFQAKLFIVPQALYTNA